MDISRFYIDGTGFIDFYEKSKYLGPMLHHWLTSVADVYKRVTSATAAFGALNFLLTSIFQRNLRVKYTRLLSCLLNFTVAKFGPCVKIYLSAFEVSTAGLLVACAVWTSIIPSAIISLPRVSSVVWAFMISTVTFVIGFFVGLATSHVCPWVPWAGRHGSYWRAGYRILARLAVHRWPWAGRWGTRSKVRAFRRNSMGGSPLPNTGRQLTHSIPKPPDALWLKETSKENSYNVTIALRKRTLSPVRLVLKVTFFCCYMPQWCFFAFGENKLD